MSCKSAIYAVNTAEQTVPVGGIINLGSITRRYGTAIGFSGGVNLTEPGYYDVSVSITAEPTAAGPVTVTLYRDGVAIPGATATTTAAAADDPVNLSIAALIRVLCHCADNTLTLVLTGTEAVITNVALVAEKI